ncbi:hypothetical protein JXB41_02145 [Candidatus Woesearchaeota archaeon]|nr:hypothetical protein [Candidatus Woesearchaeota archaeon]
MKNMKIAIKKKTVNLVIALAITLIALFSVVFGAEPDGAAVTYISNSTKNATPPQSRNDSKGTITTLVLTAVQQNTKWKAYVGNVTGTLVLKDSSDYSIYEWTALGNPTGEVYITRNETITWANIKCANSTIIENEQTAINHSSIASDNINSTFSNIAHTSFWVGDITQIASSSCQSTATWVNDSSQTIDENALFQEILLQDDLNLIYATILEQDEFGYRNDSSTTYDFQAIIADSGLPGSEGQITYYFYVEIQSS